jgi:hypothetical protein
VPNDRPRNRPSAPGPGVYRGKVPSVTEIQADSEPPSGEALLEPEEEDTGLKSADSLVSRLAEKNRENHELREQLAQLQATVGELVRRSEHPPAAKPDSDGVELSVRSKGIKWGAVVSALSVLLGLGGVGLGVRNVATTPAPQPPVAPVAAANASLEQRVAKLERCFAAERAADEADADFVEKALELAGAVLPRRPNDPPPRVVTVDAQPLVSGQRGARPVYRITSSRPARPVCQ